MRRFTPLIFSRKKKVKSKTKPKLKRFIIPKTKVNKKIIKILIPKLKTKPTLKPKPKLKTKRKITKKIDKEKIIKLIPKTVIMSKEKRKARKARRKARRKKIVIGGVKIRTGRAKRLKKKGKLEKKLKKIKKRRTIVMSVILAPLLPLKKPMIKALEKKGISTKKMKFPDIVNRFYNEFVSKKNNPTSQYDLISDNYLSDHYLNAKDSYDYNEEEDHLAGVTVGGIVTAVITFFKKLKDKKAKGEKLLASEEIMVSDVVDVEDDLKKKAEGEKPVKEKQMKQIIMYVLIVVVVGIIIYAIRNK